MKSDGKSPSCATDQCCLISAGANGFVLGIGLILIIVVLATVPTEKECGLKLDCKRECLHGDFGDSIRKACCDGLEDCGSRALKWLLGWFMAVTGLIVCLSNVCCLRCDGCRKGGNNQVGVAMQPAGVVQAAPVQAMQVQAVPMQAMPVQAVPVQAMAMPVQAMPIAAQPVS